MRASVLGFVFLAGCSAPLAPEAGAPEAPRPAAVPPEWASGAIWYQIFPERFRNGDPTNDPTPESMEGAWPQLGADSLRRVGWTPTPWTWDWYEQEPWAEAIRPGDFYFGAQLRRFGGDLQGILDELPYLEEPRRQHALPQSAQRQPQPPQVRRAHVPPHRPALRARSCRRHGDDGRRGPGRSRDLAVHIGRPPLSRPPRGCTRQRPPRRPGLLVEPHRRPVLGLSRCPRQRPELALRGLVRDRRLGRPGDARGRVRLHRLGRRQHAARVPQGEPDGQSPRRHPVRWESGARGSRAHLRHHAPLAGPRWRRRSARRRGRLPAGRGRDGAAGLLARVPPGRQRRKPRGDPRGRDLVAAVADPHDAARAVPGRRVRQRDELPPVRAGPAASGARGPSPRTERVRRTRRLAPCQRPGRAPPRADDDVGQPRHPSPRDDALQRGGPLQKRGDPGAPPRLPRPAAR